MGGEPGALNSRTEVKISIAVLWFSAIVNVMAATLIYRFTDGVERYNEEFTSQRVSVAINSRAQDICNECVEQFKRQYGIDQHQE